MAITIQLKQNDTRPVQAITLWEPDPTDPTGQTLRVVDLTDASSAVLIVRMNPDTDPTTFTSDLDIALPATAGVVVYTPIAADTATDGDGEFEVEVTWSDSGVETYPNDSYGAITITKDLG